MLYNMYLTITYMVLKISTNIPTIPNSSFCFFNFSVQCFENKQLFFANKLNEAMKVGSTSGLCVLLEIWLMMMTIRSFIFGLLFWSKCLFFFVFFLRQLFLKVQFCFSSTEPKVSRSVFLQPCCIMCWS